MIPPAQRTAPMVKRFSKRKKSFSMNISPAWLRSYRGYIPDVADQHGNTEKVATSHGNITVSDSEVDDYITKLKAEAKQAYEKSASSYATDSEYKKVWIPEDARYIKYIAVGIASSDYAEINA